MRVTGLAVACGFDSGRVPFLTEAVVYFVLLVVGNLLALVSTWFWLKISRYCDQYDMGVIVPSEYQIRDESMSSSGRSASSVEWTGTKGAAAVVESKST
jgi:hypothetical protein